KKGPLLRGGLLLGSGLVLCLRAHAPALKHESPAPNQEQAYQQDQREAVGHLGAKNTASTPLQSTHGPVTVEPYASAHA
ncbi:MAG: hypothetical protein WB804_03875, partial [Candidatus Dormiibacterota bacterium]